MTDTETKGFQTHGDWESHKPGEGTKDFLYSLGYRHWGFDTYKYIGASDSVINAWKREDFATLIQMFKAYHAPYQREWHLNSLPFLPMRKAIKLWESLSREPHTAIKSVMLYLQLAGMSSFLYSFSRYPQEGFTVADYFATTELAPAAAHAFDGLKTLR